MPLIAPAPPKLDDPWQGSVFDDPSWGTKLWRLATLAAGSPESQLFGFTQPAIGAVSPFGRATMVRELSPGAEEALAQKASRTWSKLQPPKPRPKVEKFPDVVEYMQAQLENLRQSRRGVGEEPRAERFSMPKVLSWVQQHLRREQPPNLSQDISDLARNLSRYESRMLPASRRIAEDLESEGLRVAQQMGPPAEGKTIVQSYWWPMKRDMRRLRQELTQAVPLPQRHARLRALVNEVREKTYTRTGQYPLDEEVAETVNKRWGTSLNQEDVLRLRSTPEIRESLSLDPVTGRMSLPHELAQEVRPDVFQVPPDALSKISRAQLLDRVDAALVDLPARQKEAIVYRLGLGGETPMKLEQIGAKLGVSKQRAAQLLEEATAALRKQLGPDVEGGAARTDLLSLLALGAAGASGAARATDSFEDMVRQYAQHRGADVAAP